MANSLLSVARNLLAKATPEEAAEITALLTELQGPWVPLPGPQTDAYESLADELFYGGAAGGGKTDLMLGLAGSQHHRSIIFRREFTQFTGADGMIDRSYALYDKRGTYKTQEKTWWLTDGRAIEFGAVEHEEDWRKHQGHPHDFCGFDEVTQFTATQYTMLRTWLRTIKIGQRTRTVATFNPPTTTDGEWVLAKIAPWIDPKHPNPAKPGELRWYAVLDDDEIEVDGPEPIQHGIYEILPWSRTFVPSRVENNPYLMATGYVRRLDSLPEPLRSQMRRGDMLAGKTDDPWQVIPTAWVVAAQDRWTKRTDKDKGGEQCAGVDVARGGKDQFVIAERYGMWVDELKVHPGAEVPDGNTGAELILAAVGPGGAANVDIINVGASTVDFAIQAGLRIRGINNAASAPAGSRDKSGQLGFVNVRAYGMWKMRELLDPDRDGLPLALPPDPELRADLCSAKWHVAKTGIQIESKDDIKKRLGRSPDKGDAVVLACAFTPALPKIVQPADYGRRSFTTGRKLFLR